MNCWQAKQKVLTRPDAELLLPTMRFLLTIQEPSWRRGSLISMLRLGIKQTEFAKPGLDLVTLLETGSEMEGKG